MRAAAVNRARVYCQEPVRNSALRPVQLELLDELHVTDRITYRAQLQRVRDSQLCSQS
jgi:hypothetical protein